MISFKIMYKKANMIKVYLKKKYILMWLLIYELMDSTFKLTEIIQIAICKTVFF